MRDKSKCVVEQCGQESIGLVDKGTKHEFPVCQEHAVDYQDRLNKFWKCLKPGCNNLVRPPQKSYCCYACQKAASNLRMYGTEGKGRGSHTQDLRMAKAARTHYRRARSGRTVRY